MALVSRKISTSFVLGEGSFGDSGSNTLEISQLRTSAQISNAGGAQMAHLSLDIWGVTPSIMGQLATLGPNTPTLSRINSVIVKAGDDQRGMSIVFTGTVTDGYSDYQSSPQVPFHIEANAGSLNALIPLVPPLAYPDGGDAVTMLKGLADKMGLKFEPNGVNRTLPKSYFSGSARQAVQDICNNANIEWAIDNDTLAVWEPNKSRSGTTPLINKDTGMQGYPAYTFAGIVFRTLFNPNLRFGGQVEVHSSRPELIKTNGIWNINGLDHYLDAEVPGGNWYTSVQAYNPDRGTVVSTPT